MNAFISSGAANDAAVDMALRKSKVGRQRAFAKLCKGLGSGVVCERSRLTGKHPMAVWSTFKPRTAIATPDNDFADAAERGSMLQDCVAVEYIIAGCVPEETVSFAMGLWTLEVPDHALGRAVERSRFLHPGAIIREAHTNLLAAPTDSVKRLSDHQLAEGVYLKAGPGCFVGSFVVGPDVSGKFNIHFRVATWLHDDQLRDDQVPLPHGDRQSSAQQFLDGPVPVPLPRA